MRPYILTILILTSCTVPDKASLAVKKETRSLRRSHVTLTAHNTDKKTESQLKLRENNSFEYSSYTLGSQKSVFYAGTFTKTGDNLILTFHNNYKDSLWTGIAVIDTTTKQIILYSKYNHLNKIMTITKLK